MTGGWNVRVAPTHYRQFNVRKYMYSRVLSPPRVLRLTTNRWCHAGAHTTLPASLLGLRLLLTGITTPVWFSPMLNFSLILCVKCVLFDQSLAANWHHQVINNSWCWNESEWSILRALGAAVLTQIINRSYDTSAVLNESTVSLFYTPPSCYVHHRPPLSLCSGAWNLTVFALPLILCGTCTQPLLLLDQFSHCDRPRHNFTKPMLPSLFQTLPFLIKKAGWFIRNVALLMPWQCECSRLVWQLEWVLLLNHPRLCWNAISKYWTMNYTHNLSLVHHRWIMYPEWTPQMRLYLTLLFF